jgi:hypothetical protein
MSSSSASCGAVLAINVAKLLHCSEKQSENPLQPYTVYLCVFGQRQQLQATLGKLRLNIDHTGV